MFICITHQRHTNQKELPMANPFDLLSMLKATTPRGSDQHYSPGMSAVFVLGVAVAIVYALKLLFCPQEERLNQGQPLLSDDHASNSVTEDRITEGSHHDEAMDAAEDAEAQDDDAHTRLIPPTR
jgi:hypothetical protein